MKKVMLGLTAMALIFAACKKDDASPETYYLSKIIEVGEDGNDTTFISYNADNTFKELYSSAGDEFYGEGPAYEGGKIVAIMERSSFNPTSHKTKSFVYTGNNVTRVNYWSTQDGQTTPASIYDSLVYVNGKLSEFHHADVNMDGYSTKYVLTWEGDNVKTCTTYMKQAGSDYSLFDVTKYTYDTRPALYKLLTGNYYWLSDLTSFDYLSANNVTKEEVFRQDILRSTYTNAYTYEGNLLKMVDSEDKDVDPARTETYKVKLEYATR